MATFSIICGCQLCDCENAVGEVELPDGVASSSAVSGYLCKTCGLTPTQIQERRWVEVCEVIPDHPLKTPVPIFNLIVREPHKEIRDKENFVVTIGLCHPDGSEKNLPFLLGPREHVVKNGRCRVSGLYVSAPGTYMLKIEAPGFETVYSTEFRVI
jgi:hypothetical protein